MEEEGFYEELEKLWLGSSMLVLLIWICGIIDIEESYNLCNSFRKFWDVLSL